jgi:hypothetical protein
VNLKCPTCGAVHVVVSAEYAREKVARINAKYETSGSDRRTEFSVFQECRVCSAPAAGFLPTTDPQTMTHAEVVGETNDEK